MATNVMTNVELIFWNMPHDGQPTVDKAKAGLQTAGLDPDRASPIPNSTAFHRACYELKEKGLLVREFQSTDTNDLVAVAKDHKVHETPGNKVGDTFAVKQALPSATTIGDIAKATKLKPARIEGILRFLVARVSNTSTVGLSVQIDEETVKGKELHRHRLGVYTLTGEDVAAIDGACPDMLTKLKTILTHERTTYHWGDVSNIISHVLTIDGMGVFSPRRAGGVYFAPVQEANKGLLDKVESFCDTLGMRFLRYQIPDTDIQRAEISEAIGSALEMDLDGHAKAVATYGEESKAGVVENRRNAVFQAREQVAKLAHLLSPETKDKLDDKADDIEAAIALVEKAIDAYQTSQQRKARRRIS